MSPRCATIQARSDNESMTPHSGLCFVTLTVDTTEEFHEAMTVPQCCGQHRGRKTIALRVMPDAGSSAVPRVVTVDIQTKALMSRTISTNKQCFSLTTDQRQP